MTPKLYITQLSPPVRAVLMCAKAINLELDLIEINLLEREHLEPEFLKLNPLHTVPTLDDDGFVLYDSHAIMGYLIGKYAEDKSLYPEEIQERAVIDQRLHFDSGVFFPRSLRIVVSILYRGVKEMSQENIETINEVYGFIETFLEDKIYIAGNSLSIADFSILATITNSDVLVPVDEEKYPNISSWKKIMQTLPYCDINEAGGDVFRSIIEAKLSE